MINGRSLVSASASLMLAMILSGPALAADEPAAFTYDGLELVKKSRLDVVYRRPGVDFSSYNKFMLDPFEVAFKKQWTRDFRRVSNSDRERIRRDLANEARKVFVEELQEKGGYQIVEAPGPDVLRVTAGIIELYINAPDTMSTGRSRTYTLSTGEATLVAELRDSESGAVLARAADHERARESVTLQWTTRADNRADARIMLKKWAGTLREGLNEARGMSK
jgi:uncharacterized protein DUF3313